MCAYRSNNMEFTLDGTGRILEKTPSVLRALLGGLSDNFVKANYGHGTWSPHEILGHLIHGEKTDWMPRARHILQVGESVPFEPFDRNGHILLCRDKSTSELLGLFD